MSMNRKSIIIFRSENKFRTHYINKYGVFFFFFDPYKEGKEGFEFEHVTYCSQYLNLTTRSRHQYGVCDCEYINHHTQVTSTKQLMALLMVSHQLHSMRETIDQTQSINIMALCPCHWHLKFLPSCHTTSHIKYQEMK